jgi:hypothetical protein
MEQTIVLQQIYLTNRSLARVKRTFTQWLTFWKNFCPGDRKTNGRLANNKRTLCTKIFHVPLVLRPKLRKFESVYDLQGQMQIACQPH